MLPVTRHSRRWIPHNLAIVAAAMGLISAFMAGVAEMTEDATPAQSAYSSAPAPDEFHLQATEPEAEVESPHLLQEAVRPSTRPERPGLSLLLPGPRFPE